MTTNKTPLEQNTKPHVLIVDRRYWGRGATGGSLFDGTDFGGTERMCILGLYLHKVVGIPKERLLGKAYPHAVAQQDPKSLLGQFAKQGACWLIESQPNTHCEEGVKLTDSAVAQELYMLNDTSAVSNSVREQRIKDKFAKYNVIVEFIN